MPLQDLQYGSKTKLTLDSLDPSLSLSVISTNSFDSLTLFKFFKARQNKPKSYTYYKNVVLKICFAWLTHPISGIKLNVL